MTAGCSPSDECHEAAGLNTYTPAELVARELKNSQHRANGARWLQLANDSAADVQRVVDHGGSFWHYDEIDMAVLAKEAINVQSDYSMTPLIFEDCSSLEHCIKPLAASAVEQGGQIILSTRATSLIQSEDGTVRGLYAEGPDGAVQVNAKAVVLATGGFSHNKGFVARAGWDLEETLDCNMGYEDGDGYAFGLAAGAQDCISEGPHGAMGHRGVLGARVERPGHR